METISFNSFSTILCSCGQSVIVPFLRRVEKEKKDFGPFEKERESDIKSR